MWLWLGLVLVFWGISHHPGTEASLMEKGSATRVQGVELGVSKIGSQCQHWVASFGCFCVYAERNDILWTILFKITESGFSNANSLLTLFYNNYSKMHAFKKINLMSPHAEM